MKEKTYFGLTAFIFLIVALAHALRLLFSPEAVMIGGYPVPKVLSVAAIIIAGYITSAGFTLYRQASQR